MTSEELYDLVNELQDLLIAHATSGSADPARYVVVRRALRANEVTKELLPDFVAQCRDLPQFWSFIKAQFSTYADRREFLWAKFRPLLDLLEEAPSKPVSQPHCWVPNRLRLFISHVSVYKQRAEELKKTLEPWGITGFVAHSDIEPTREWQDEIEAALLSCDGLVALLTPTFHESKWTDQEIGAVLGRGKLIIPLRVGVDPYGFIGKFQGLTAKGRTAREIAPDLLRILARHASTRRAYANALVATLETSRSWESSRALMDALELFTDIETALLVRMQRSVTTNEKVAESYGVPERIKQLCLRLGGVV